MDASTTPVLIPILDDTAIAAAMQRARVLGCPPTGRRCAFVPRTAEAALETLTADGWCRIGSLLDVRSHGLECDGLFHLDRGDVRLERLP